MRENGFKAYSINKSSEPSCPKSTFIFIEIRKLALKEQFQANNHLLNEKKLLIIYIFYQKMHTGLKSTLGF
jgi:hypothetical protein